MLEPIGKKPSRGVFRRLWSLATEFAEPLIAAAAAFVLAILGLAGWVTGDPLTAATLLVLSVVAVSLIGERSLRVQASQSIEELGSQLAETTDAVNAIHSGNPYSVLLHETTWDLSEPDGSLAFATRLKKIRIDQNNVFALYDFAGGDGERETEYSPGKAVTEFIGEGKMYRLIALGRIYYRGERLDFTAKRTVRDGFLAAHEAVTVDTRDATERMRLKILWPPGRPPTALRLGRATPSHEWKNDDVLADVKTEDDRAMYQVEILNPEKGGTTSIEWDWDPPPAPLPDSDSN
jgi:hypothetical protein